MVEVHRRAKKNKKLNQKMQAWVDARKREAKLHRRQKEMAEVKEPDLKSQ